MSFAIFVSSLVRVVFVAAVALVGYRGGSATGAAAGLLVALLVLLGEWRLRHSGTRDFLWGALGVLGGVFLAVLAGEALAASLPQWPYRPHLVAGLTLVLGYLGAVAVGLRARRGPAELGPRHRTGADGGCSPKILDTSVIIDGRIADVCKTNFVEGPLVVPRFVLKELQDIADSSDPIRRARGRRGLDMLKRMQQGGERGIEIDDAELSDVYDVDSKIVRLAQLRRARIITNDLNLNKVASLEGVVVLNVNDLANGLKPVVLPGEDMSVRLLKRGKEADQGVGYLEDGTMVVVEGASDLIGQTVPAEVTSVIQTAAGRMIFCKLRT